MWKQMFQYVCPYGTNGFLFRSFLRKFAQLDFRHMNVAKEKTHTAKNLQKKCEKKGNTDQKSLGFGNSSTSKRWEGKKNNNSISTFRTAWSEKHVGANIRTGCQTFSHPKQKWWNRYRWTMRRLWRWTVRIDLHAPMLGTAKKQKTKV